MSETQHQEEVHAAKKVANPTYRVPKFIPILIILVLAAMYSYSYYLDYVDYKTPETIVQKYFDQAYDTKDYERAADKLSVFLAFSSLPEYSNLEPSQLLKDRPEIIKKAAQVLEESAQSNDQGVIHVTPMPEYTKIGQSSALVVFKVEAAGKDQGLGVAFLIKESGRFRIINLVPLPPTSLDEIKKFDVKTLDDQANALLNPQPQSQTSTQTQPQQ